MLNMVTFTINIPQTLAYIPYMDPMGLETSCFFSDSKFVSRRRIEAGLVKDQRCVSLTWDGSGCMAWIHDDPKDLLLCNVKIL